MYIDLQHDVSKVGFTSSWDLKDWEFSRKRRVLVCRQCVEKRCSQRKYFLAFTYILRYRHLGEDDFRFVIHVFSYDSLGEEDFGFFIRLSRYGPFGEDNFGFLCWDIVLLDKLNLCLIRMLMYSPLGGDDLDSWFVYWHTDLLEKKIFSFLIRTFRYSPLGEDNVRFLIRVLRWGPLREDDFGFLLRMLKYRPLEEGDSFVEIRYLWRREFFESWYECWNKILLEKRILNSSVMM